MTASRAVVIGADTHLDTVHLAALSPTGASVADAQFPTHPAGYYLAVKWAQSFGAVLRAGVEGTSSYGSGLTRALQDAGIEVAEINRSDRAGRRRQGKSDPLDAYAAARAALAGHGLAVPKDQTTSALRAILTARRGAVKARTAAINQIKALLITAPALRMPNQTSRNSAQLGSITDTDSPGLTPRVMRPFAMRLAREFMSP